METGIRSKKDQSSSVFCDNGSKDVSIDDSLLDEEDSTAMSSKGTSQKGRSSEDKLDRLTTEFGK